MPCSLNSATRLSSLHLFLCVERGNQGWLTEFFCRVCIQFKRFDGKFELDREWGIIGEGERLGDCIFGHCMTHIQIQIFSTSKRNIHFRMYTSTH